MAITAQLIITPTSGSPVSIHGAHGHIHLTTQQGDRFRRPIAERAGYQRLGSDVLPSTLEYWQACAGSATASTFIESMGTLPYKVVTISYKAYTNIRCVITTHEVRLSHACKGPIITGSTQAFWRVEGTIGLEYAPT